jgi:hypothetical protein
VSASRRLVTADVEAMCPRCRILSFGYNRFGETESSIPDMFAGLPALECVASVRYSAPWWFVDAASRVCCNRALYLYGNGFSGSIPSSIGLCTMLRYVPLPRWPRSRPHPVLPHVLLIRWSADSVVFVRRAAILI